jgi:hypothetical protein
MFNNFLEFKNILEYNTYMFFMEDYEPITIRLLIKAQTVSAYFNTVI